MALLAVLLLFAGSCGSSSSNAQGGILDNPIGVAYLNGYLYVTNANYDLSGKGQGFLLVIDARAAVHDTPRNAAVVGKRTTSPYLADLTLDPDRQLAYIASRKDDEVIVMDISDPTDPQVVDQDPDAAGIQNLPAGHEPNSVALRPDGRYLYVANNGGGNVSVVDLESKKLARSISLKGGLLDIVMQPGADYAWVTNRRTNTISLIDTVANDFAASFTPIEAGAALLTDTRGIAFTPDGTKAYIAVQTPALLLDVDTARLPDHPESAVVSYIPMRSVPYGVALSPDGTECWVTNFGRERVLIIDTRIDQVVGRVGVGKSPTSLVTVHFEEDDPTQYYVFVTDFRSHTLAIIDGLTRTELGWIQ